MIRFWDVASGRELCTFRAHAKEVMSVAFRKDGTLLATGSRGGEVKLWIFPAAKRWRALQGHSAAIYRGLFHSSATVGDGKL